MAYKLNVKDTLRKKILKKKIETEWNFLKYDVHIWDSLWHEQLLDWTDYLPFASAELCAMVLLYEEGMRCVQSYKVPDLKKLCKSLFMFEWIPLYDFFQESLTQSQGKNQKFPECGGGQRRRELNTKDNSEHKTPLNKANDCTCLCSFVEICRMIPAKKLVANCGLGWQYMITINIPLS